MAASDTLRIHHIKVGQHIPDGNSRLIFFLLIRHILNNRAVDLI